MIISIRMILKRLGASLAALCAGSIGVGCVSDVNAITREIESYERTKIILEELIEHFERQRDQRDNTYSNKDDSYHYASSEQLSEQLSEHENSAPVIEPDRSSLFYRIIPGVNALQRSNTNNMNRLNSSASSINNATMSINNATMSINNATSSLQNSILSGHNNIRAQNAVDATLNSLDDPKRDFDEGDAKRVALTLLTGQDIGAVVEWGYSQVDEVRRVKKEWLEKPLEEYTGVKWGFSFSGGISGEVDAGIRARKKLNVFGLSGELSLELKEQSWSDFAYGNSQASALTSSYAYRYREPVLNSPLWLMALSDEDESPTITLAYTIKFPSGKRR